MQPIYQSYQQQQQFTANAAHELRSPLASLLATVEATSRVWPSDQQVIQAMLNTIERQGRRLGRLVDDLLLLSSLEQHTTSVSLQPCCLNDLISDLSEGYMELASAAGISLSSDIPERSIHVTADEQQLFRLTSNLIANAIYHTPPGGNVHITLGWHDHLALITITDTGIGIPPNDLPHIFERFYRVNSDRSRKTGGAGLGLAIVKAIVERYQGYVTVKSHPGQGSSFTVYLPKAPQGRERGQQSS
jgi:two-component Ni(II)/redox sensor kinase NrsS